jgi:hypothetical protein
MMSRAKKDSLLVHWFTGTAANSNPICFADVDRVCKKPTKTKRTPESGSWLGKQYKEDIAGEGGERRKGTRETWREGGRREQDV